MTEVATWWFRPRNFTNFGDELGPEILSRLGYRPKRVSLVDAELVTVGSILQTVAHQPKNNVTIWGSGFISGSDPIPRSSKVLALRGPRSADKLGITRELVALGDPGLLVSKLWTKSPTRHKIGVVPHYVDKRSYPWADLVIDVTSPPDQVIAEISSCATISSSSLHGVIVAEAFGIPAVRLHHDGIRGGDFKWTDYVGARDRSVETIQQDLLSALP